MSLVTNNLRDPNDSYFWQASPLPLLNRISSVASSAWNMGASGILSIKSLAVTWSTSERENLVLILDGWINEAQGFQKTSRIIAKDQICNFFDKNQDSLYLNYLNLTSLPEKIFDSRCFQRIVSLDLRGNRLTNLPLEMGKLSSLQVLRLSNNQLQDDAWTTLSKLLGLVGLDLSHNQIKNLSSEIGHLQSLQELDLSYNELESLHPGIGDLGFLRFLLLNNNKLESLPPEIGNLKSLVELKLSDNQLQDDIWTALSKLLGLRNLDLNNNKLENLSPEIEDLKSLKILHLSKNHLKDEACVRLTKLTGLNTLSLSSNEIENLPKEIGDLENLRELYARNNQLKELPSEMGTLNSLQKVLLSNNQLKDDAWTTLSKLLGLDTLVLGRNQIKNLSSEIGHLQSLQNLDLSYNKLESLPPEIENLGSLQQLVLTGNTINGEYIDKLTESLVSLQFHPIELLPLKGPLYKGIIYRILDNLGEEKGYLSPTMHFTKSPHHRISPTMLNAVKKAQSIALELDFSYLKDFDLSRIKEAMNPSGVENRLVTLAFVYNKKMYGLEPLEFHQDSSGLNEGREQSQIELIDKKYQEGDKTSLKELMLEFLKDERDPSYMRRMYFDRNCAMADGIDQFLRKEEFPFVGIGAAHLWGPKEDGKKGVVALLREKGWTVERMQT